MLAIWMAAVETPIPRIDGPSSKDDDREKMKANVSVVGFYVAIQTSLNFLFLAPMFETKLGLNLRPRECYIIGKTM